MIGRKINSKQPIALFELKELLTERSAEGELTFEQQTAFDYAKKFTVLTKAKSEKLVTELKKIEGLSDDLIVKIVDLVPETKEELNLILSKGNDLTDSQTEAILQLIQKYAKK
ncbi:MAG: DNA-directed RNA polymerase subunit F [Candidatus Diapherotrites archaeon]|nr:DNA-directed RNA polymerase subunit F [Candidatus Diapherotrites archaeon]